MEQTHNTNHGNSVKKRRKQSSTCKHNNNNNNPNPDLINALPDSLLLDILSFLNMKDVMNTTLLSRRWRYLWRSIPCLCFESFMGFNFIDRCLFHHQGSKIHKLHINFGYKDTHSPLVDSWLYFATKCEVEDFELDLSFAHWISDEPPCYKVYNLPRSFYLCTTLTSLNLCCCHLNLPDSFHLASLKKLSLRIIELYPDSIERLSSSCPSLEEIYLKDCFMDGNPNIVITNEHVKKLVISQFSLYGSASVKINAPTLRTFFLKLYKRCPNVRIHIEELGSLMSAGLIGYSLFARLYDDIVDLKEVRNCVEKLLYGFRHVEHLKLGGWFLQVLSSTKLQSSNILSISATFIELKTSLRKCELPGIIYLLESCSNLQKLKIMNTIFCDENEPSEEFDWESFENGVPSIMQNIKFIEIDVGGESSHQEFIKFLLKKAKVLEKMVINTLMGHYYKYKLSQMLNAFPRSSPNAKVFIT